MCNPSKFSGILSRAAAVALAAGTVSVRPVAAQVNTFHACYVPTVGAMYMIKLAGLPPACLSPTHTEIIWTDSGGVANGSITTLKLADLAVTTIKLAPDAVGSAQVQDGSLTGTDFAAGAVGAAQLANGAVDSLKVKDGSLNGADLATGAVGAAQLANGAVDSLKVKDGSLSGADLAAGAVTQTKIAPNAVGSPQIAVGAVGNAQVLDGSLTGADFSPGAVGTLQLGNGSVTRSKLGSDAFAAIAWGFVSLNGALVGHSANVISAPFNAGIGAYLITISGESYNTNYATIVTANSPTLITRALPVTVNSVPYLGVFLYDLTGTPVQGNFQFVTFK